MKVLWVSHQILSNNVENKSGVWQKSLALQLLQDKSMILGNIAPGNCSKPVFDASFLEVQQWQIPIKNKRVKELSFNEILKEFNPDLIHVWGSENFLQLIPFNNSYNIPVVLFMQGVLDSVADVYYKSMNCWDVIKTIRLREIITRNNIVKSKVAQKKRGLLEIEMIKDCHYIAVQSEWTASQIRHLNSEALFFRVNLALRNEFILSQKWENLDSKKPVLLALIGMPLKAIDTVILATEIVKKSYPNIELRIVGATGRLDYFADGYVRYILKLIEKKGLKENVRWLGALNTYDLIDHFLQTSVFLNPSLIESYSLLFAEAMALGVPSVVSYAGAMPELATPNVEALFFTPMDFKNCAYQILKILDNPDLGTFISKNAIARTINRDSNISIKDAHINIYKEVIDLETKKINR